MGTRGRSRAVALGLLLAAFSIAPAPPDPGDPSDLKTLAEARYKASLKGFDEAWVYYRQARTNPYFVYAWSLMVVDARMDLSSDKADHIVAIEEHLERMRKLESIVNKVRQLGFERSIDIASSDYFVKDARYRLERAKAK